MWIRILMSVSIASTLLGGVLFLSAGRTDWAEAWVVVVFYTAYLLAFMTWGAIHAPDLMRERSRIARNVKKWDKVLNALYMLLLAVLLIVSGLDVRYKWSSIPQWFQWIGGLGMICSSYIIWRTMKENAYLSRWARIQEDREQKVITSGPYQFVRHPMYASILVFVISMTCVLGSGWALIPAGLAVSVYLVRTSLEDRMLHEELAGYREYAAKVPYRLMPGIW